MWIPQVCEDELNIHSVFLLELSHCFHFYISGAIKLLILSDCERQIRRWASPITTMLATSLSSNLVKDLRIKVLPGQAQTCQKDLCLANSKFQSQPVSILGFSLVGRMIDSRLIGELWISVPSSQILGGIQPITAQGHQDKVQRVDASAGCTLTPNVHARGYSRMQREREKRPADIKLTKWDLAGYGSCNWTRKNVSRFHLKAVETKEEAVKRWVTVTCQLLHSIC